MGNPDMVASRKGLRVKNSQNGGKKGASGESNVKEWALQNFGSLQMWGLYRKPLQAVKGCCLYGNHLIRPALLGLCHRRKGGVGRGPEQDWKPRNLSEVPTLDKE